MRVGDHEADSTLDNALSQSRMFGLTRQVALEEIRAVAKVVEGWKEQFAATGVSARDIELLTEQIDRPFLREQRQAVLT
jgi:serine/threonine-protein kinase HipA